jgi:secreted Zn-dependent insulinase-like peptidase
MDLRIENVIKLMRKRLVETSEEKFEKYKDIIGRRIKRKDGSLKRRSERLWNEIIRGNNNYNINSKLKQIVRKLEKKHMIKFFDDLFTNNLAKLSIQEFSNKVKRIPRKTPKVKGRIAKIIKSRNMFRKRNKFIK